MKGWLRRDLLKGGVALPGAAILGMPGMTPVAEGQSGGAAESKTAGETLRERSLLDFGWRFHFGHANDAAKDFGFAGGFQKTGGFLDPSSLAYDDSGWKPVDLPHDWAVELPFQNDPALTSKGSYPLGRGYPETSVGWYRRVFEIPESDDGRRFGFQAVSAYPGH